MKFRTSLLISAKKPLGFFDKDCVEYLNPFGKYC